MPSATDAARAISDTLAPSKPTRAKIFSAASRMLDSLASTRAREVWRGVAGIEQYPYTELNSFYMSCNHFDSDLSSGVNSTQRNERQTA